MEMYHKIESDKDPEMNGAYMTYSMSYSEATLYNYFIYAIHQH